MPSYERKNNCKKRKKHDGKLASEIVRVNKPLILFEKFQLSDETKEDKTMKKKRLDDIMLGLGAAKGVNLVTML